LGGQTAAKTSGQQDQPRQQRALHTISTALIQPELDPAENHAIRGAGTPHAPKSMAERGTPDNLRVAAQRKQAAGHADGRFQPDGRAR
jgi:hypothetical protein